MSDIAARRSPSASTWPTTSSTRAIEEGRGDHVAVIDDDGRYTYRQVQALANQVGNALSARGVGVEDRVLIGLSDGVEFAATFFGVLKIGAVVTMVNPELPDGDYEHYLDYTRARALVGDIGVDRSHRAADRRRRSCSRGRHVGARRRRQAGARRSAAPRRR